MRVGKGGTGIIGPVTGSALGKGSRVNHETHHHYHGVAGAQAVWPVTVGTVPPPVSAPQPRSAVRAKVDAARARGGPVVLTQVLSGGGGVGKTQLAAAYAHHAQQEEHADLTVWITATEEQQIITAYAHAAALVQAPGVGGSDPEADAQAFLAWLATTQRRWLIVLDDIADPAAVGRWWPSGRPGAGWTLATTRLEDAALTGGGRTRVRVDTYTPQEADAYLRERFAHDDAAHLLDDHAGELIKALGFLPLALSHATAHMINQHLTTSEYLVQFTDIRTRLDHILPVAADAERYGRTVAATLLLGLDAVRATDPTGLAEPALHLISLLDPTGHPAILWDTEPALQHLTEHRSPRQTPTAARDRSPSTSTGKPRLRRRLRRGSRKPDSAEIHDALRTLHRYALITHNPTDPLRAVRIHALTARAVREALTETQHKHTAKTAADGLLACWPDPDTHPDHHELTTTLRTNTDTLHHHTGEHLWHPDAHPLLFRAGRSLLNAGLHAPATTHWQHLHTTSERVLGPNHRDTLTTRANLAASHWQAGRTEEAIELEEQVLTARDRVLGPNHRDTLTTRTNLAASYQQAGRTEEAIELLEQVLTARERVLGPNHRDTLTTRTNLAASYQQAGRTEEAIELLEQVLTASERVLGPNHPDTLTTRTNLAASYQQAGRTEEAIELLEQVLTASERVLGPNHPDTLTARGNLAASYQQAGRTEEAIELEEQVLTARDRILGPDHPNTLTTRGNLAFSHWQAGRTEEAIELEEQVLTARDRILGPNHPDTLTARGNLAASYQQAGRTEEAIELLEQVLTARERVLGPDHPDTLTARGNLAFSHWQAGRTEEAIELEEQVLTARDRILGPNHPDTLTTRGNLAASYQQAGRTEEAIELLEQVLTASERVLGPDHPRTIVTRRALERWRTEPGGEEA
ncbi:tetratricopeptide repeat protein [Streptomyces clavuligerus]|uniref:tetratricopeptide repeat protein n=4 Tax=Streptomyces clavuligerus TaxID=1901 RepID=UPI000185169B|nr:tetratricopeptide repeat protein [Streptomyces clavuligerus]MBY6300971.1 tetratricopeptide repeat protein [Streptomyces clavuligerus]QPJ97017.1 tetratricopeptide repeat protein [Streptomyces clavuligerus]WDN55781.1 tetratricopeptide repeat protein [Streptomyces clavuligerus]